MTSSAGPAAAVAIPHVPAVANVRATTTIIDIPALPFIRIRTTKNAKVYPIYTSRDSITTTFETCFTAQFLTFAKAPHPFQQTVPPRDE